MIKLSPDEISRKQSRLKNLCEKDTARILDAGKNFFDSIFRDATIMANSEEGTMRAPSEIVLRNKIFAMNEWVSNVLALSISVYGNVEAQIPIPKAIRLPKEIAAKLIETVIRIFSCGKDIDAAALSFASQISEILDMTPRETLLIIEQVQYEIRKEAFTELVSFLTDEQCDLCAILLLKAIRADDRLHPAEIKYFENISQLLKSDQTRLEAVEEACELFDFSVEPRLEKEISSYMFQYIIEIVMCDGQYDPRESALVQGIASFFGYDKFDQDQIIQPVASMVMAKSELFRI